MEAETLNETWSTENLGTLLSQAREQLEALVSNLRAVDAELEALATERRQHGLLQDAYAALEELGTLGAPELFWGTGAAAATPDEHMRRVRTRLDEFHERIGAIENRRRALLEEVHRQQEQTCVLEDDVFEALEEEERRKHEWIVEREIGEARSRATIMPWERHGEDDRRFRKSLRTALLVCLLFTVALPFVEFPVTPEDEPVEIPERIVSMMMERETFAPPPPPEPPKPRPEEKLAKQEPVEKPVEQRVAGAEAPQPAPDEKPETPQGILAFREKLAQVRDASIVAQLGLQARVNTTDTVARPERSMLTTNAPGSSGGIRLASLSRNTGGNERGAIQGATLTQASSSINAIAPADRPHTGGPGPARTDEEIQIVFDRYKAALYRLYNRELREDPTLQGKMILRLTIEPDGSVSFCQLQATDMDAPALVTQIVARVRTFDFGAKEVPAITIIYPIDFLPAA